MVTKNVGRLHAEHRAMSLDELREASARSDSWRCLLGKTKTVAAYIKEQRRGPGEDCIRFNLDIWPCGTGPYVSGMEFRAEKPNDCFSVECVSMKECTEKLGQLDSPEMLVTGRVISSGNTNVSMLVSDMKRAPLKTKQR